MYEVKDDRGIPISAGIPPIVIIAASIGVVMVFVIIGLVLGNSSFGHAWPAADSQTINLNV
jgi:hypothetical protein